MEQLPDLLHKGIASACASGRQLSWKIQEGPKGTLIQLIWRAEDALSFPSAVLSGKMGSNLSNQLAGRSLPVSKSQQQPARLSKKSPSKIRRNAKRLQAFLERKQEHSRVASQGEVHAPRSLLNASPVEVDLLCQCFI